MFLRDNQHPELYGDNASRFLFDGKQVGGDPSLISGFFDSSRGYILRAGETHGIAAGMSFEVYKTDLYGDCNPPIGRLFVEKVEPLMAILANANDQNCTIPNICGR